MAAVWIALHHCRLRIISRAACTGRKLRLLSLTSFILGGFMSAAIWSIKALLPLVIAASMRRCAKEGRRTVPRAHRRRLCVFGLNGCVLLHGMMMMPLLLMMMTTMMPLLSMVAPVVRHMLMS